MQATIGTAHPAHSVRLVPTRPRPAEPAPASPAPCAQLVRIIMHAGAQIQVEVLKVVLDVLMYNKVML